MYHDGEACFFPCKKAYDLHRNLPSSLPVCIIRDMSRYTDCDEFEEKPDTDDAPVPGGKAPAEAAADTEAEPQDEEDVSVPGGDAPDDEIAKAEEKEANQPEDTKADETKPEGADASSEGYHYRQDAIGRWYKFDKIRQ